MADYLLSGLGLPADAPQDLRSAAAGRLGLAAGVLSAVRVVRRSLDGRGRPKWVYNLVVTSERELPLPRFCPPPPIRFEPLPDRVAGRERPVVVGAGPAGLFCALVLAGHGLRPVVLERGRQVEGRVADVARFHASGRLDPDSNLLYGEGGAGTFSDGKLHTRRTSPHTALLLDTLVAAGAPEEIVADGRPHVGSDRLREVVPRLRVILEQQGVNFRFGTAVRRLAIDGGRVTGVVTGEGRIDSTALFLCCGYAAEGLLLTVAAQGGRLTARSLQLGVRIEHPAGLVSEMVYGRWQTLAGLPPAEYQLVAEGGGLRSFCMCPGGSLVCATHREGRVITNGMSLHARDGAFSNAALIVTLPGPGDVGELLSFRRGLERRAAECGGGGFRAPAQRADDFLAGRPSTGTIESSYPFGLAPGDLRRVMPAAYGERLAAGLRRMEETFPGFASRQAALVAAETRVTSPIRLERDPEGCEATGLPGLFPAGEGPGHASGIASSALDGIRTALAWIARLRSVA